MTVKEFLKYMGHSITVSFRNKGEEILKIDTRFIGKVKEELLDMEIEEEGILVYNSPPEVSYVTIYIK